MNFEDKKPHANKEIDDLSKALNAYYSSTSTGHCFKKSADKPYGLSVFAIVRSTAHTVVANGLFDVKRQTLRYLAMGYRSVLIESPKWIHHVGTPVGGEVLMTATMRAKLF